MTATVIFLVTLEVAARTADPYHGDIGIVRASPTRGVALTPGFRGRYDGHPVYVNDLGFRDADGRSVRVAQAIGTRRVMAFGDSFTFGQEIAFDVTYPHLTEQRLKEIAPASGWEVINAGVPGYGPTEELAYMRETIDAYRPDVVVLQYTLNDAYAIPPETGWRKVFRPILDVLRVNSYAYQIARTAVSAITDPLPRSAADEPSDAAWYRELYRTDAPGWMDAVAQLRAIDDLLARSGIPLIVLVYGDLEEPPAALRDPSKTYGDVYPFEAYHRQVADVFAGRHAAILDSLTVLGPLPAGRVYETRRHPGPAANGAVSVALATCIVAVLGDAPLGRPPRC